jgi:hypothetical protein
MGEFLSLTRSWLLWRHLLPKRRRVHQYRLLRRSHQQLYLPRFHRVLPPFPAPPRRLYHQLSLRPPEGSPVNLAPRAIPYNLAILGMPILVIPALAMQIPAIPVLAMLILVTLVLAMLIPVILVLGMLIPVILVPAILIPVILALAILNRAIPGLSIPIPATLTSLFIRRPSRESPSIQHRRLVTLRQSW